MHTVFGQPEENPRVFADNWGWKNASTDWEQLVRSPEIGLVDVVTPNYMHAPVARAAIAAGKPVSCEKPIAGTLADAREMAAGRQGRQSEDVRLVQLPALPGRGPGPSAGQGGQARRHPPRAGDLPAGLGRRSGARCCGGSTRTWPAPAPTAI